MGWVEQAFVDRVAYGHGTPALWNEMRDSVGQAILEFNERIGGPMLGTKGFTNRDCLAQGRFCVRVLRQADSEGLEIFLDEEARLLRTSHSNSEQVAVCGYRLTEDRRLEFFTDSPEGAVAISTETACRLALASFILNPFPKHFVTGTV